MAILVHRYDSPDRFVAGTVGQPGERTFFLQAREGNRITSVVVEKQQVLVLAEHLDKVELYLGQVCQIAGISKMQLDYWTNKAQIQTKGRKQRIYDMEAVETVMLIKQAKDKGLNLGAAIDAARRFQEQNRPAALL